MPSFFFVACLLVAVSHALKLELASVLFRHGDRSPTHTYPKDKYQESHWPQGFGQLSTEGMRQEYLLGQLLRKRYVEEKELVHSNYTRVQVYVRSTDYDRTLMSAQAMLSALYPPTGDQVFDDSLPWQPIPVHTAPQSNDTLLQGYNFCPTYNELLEEDTKTQPYIDLEKENKDFFKKLEDDTGYDAVNLNNIHSLYDILFVEQINNLTLPDWVNDTLMGRLLNLTLYTGGLRFNTLKKKQLTASNWVSKVVGDMVTWRDSQENDMKLYLYSVHDTTIAAMMTALGVFNGELPPYVATFFIELLSDNNGKYWVSQYYRNDTYGTHLYPLHMKLCHNITQCSLDEFKKFTGQLIISDWEEECGLTSHTNDTQSNIAVIVLGCLLGVCVLLLCAVIICCLLAIYWGRRYRHVYTKIPNLQA